MDTELIIPDFEIVNKNEKNSVFIIKNADVSIVNSIRRAIQANVNTVAFYFDAKSSENDDIRIIQNDSPLHNEFLAQRISMIPVHFTKDIIDNWTQDEYSFEIDVQNTSQTFKKVTTKDILVFKHSTQLSEAERDRVFPANDITKDFILLTKLPPPSDSKIPTRLKAKLRCSKASGAKSSCFSPTSLCVFSNSIVEAKDLIVAEKAFVERYKNEFKKLYKAAEESPEEDAKKFPEEDIEKDAKMKFKTIEYQREFKKNKHGEPNEFKFSIDSECALTPGDIFTEAVNFLISRVENLHEKISQESTKLKSIGQDKYELLVEHENHTIGNLIQAFFYNEFIRGSSSEEKISFIGYFITHPLEQLICFKIVSKLTQTELTEFFKSGLEALKNNLTQFKDVWNQKWQS